MSPKHWQGVENARKHVLRNQHEPSKRRDTACQAAAEVRANAAGAERVQQQQPQKESQQKEFSSDRIAAVAIVARGVLVLSYRFIVRVCVDSHSVEKEGEGYNGEVHLLWPNFPELGLCLLVRSSARVVPNCGLKALIY